MAGVVLVEELEDLLELERGHLELLLLLVAAVDEGVQLAGDLEDGVLVELASLLFVVLPE